MVSLNKALLGPAISWGGGLALSGGTLDCHDSLLPWPLLRWGISSRELSGCLKDICVCCLQDICQCKLGLSPIVVYLSNTAISNFHDYGRKSITMLMAMMMMMTTMSLMVFLMMNVVTGVSI